MNNLPKGTKGGAAGLIGISDGKIPNSDRKLAPELYDDETTDESINKTVSPTSVKDASRDDSPSQPDLQGEQTMSGSTPDPTSDDDTLEAAQAMGLQMNEDVEHPQELNIARDVDLAEEKLRQH